MSDDIMRHVKVKMLAAALSGLAFSYVFDTVVILSTGFMKPMLFALVGKALLIAFGNVWILRLVSESIERETALHI
jgi:hypothetical protein